jgi:ADP-ribosyl-[dinitrogen reductase] hydrolase
VYAVLGSYENYTLNPSLDVVLCSHAALVSFMHARTLEGAILSAINLGGDADTVGACCGALAGAFWGFDAIPHRWRKVLESCEKIRNLAEILWKCAEQGS